MSTLLLGHRGHRLGRSRRVALLAPWANSARPRRGGGEERLGPAPLDGQVAPRPRRARGLSGLGLALQGSPQLELENTIAAFDRALAAGCDGLELDLHLTRDRRIVIHHDPRLPRAYGGALIAGATLGELRRAMPVIPTLEEVLKRYGARAWLDLEIKAPGLERQLLAGLRRHRPQLGYVLSCFDPRILRTLARLDGRQPLCLNLRRPATVRRLLLAGVSWVAPHTRFATRWYVERLHAAGWKVLVWTVNSPRKMRLLARAGVEVVVSDDPYLLAETLRTRG